MRLRLLATLIAGAILSGGVFLITPAGANDKVTICHAAGRAGTTKYVTLTVSKNAVYKDQGGHFYENGTPQAGHEQDYIGPCRGTVVTGETTTTVHDDETTTTIHDEVTTTVPDDQITTTTRLTTPLIPPEDISRCGAAGEAACPVPETPNYPG